MFIISRTVREPDINTFGPKPFRQVGEQGPNVISKSCNFVSLSLIS